MVAKLLIIGQCIMCTHTKNNGVNKNLCCRKNICDPCVPKLRYCGNDLDCIDIVRGDTYDNALQNINQMLCDNVSGISYQFEDNEDCRTNGFSVFQLNGDDREEIYSWCQDCCSEDVVIFNNLQNQLDFNSLDGFPMSDPPALIPNGISKFTPMDTPIQQIGNYVISANFTMEYGGSLPVSGSGIKVLFELRKNGVQIPYSTRFVKVNTGTPSPYINTFTTNCETNINASGDVIELWFNSNTDDLNNSLFVASCSITAIKK